MVNVLLKILTHTDVIALTMLSEIGACTNYFSQTLKILAEKSQLQLAALFLSTMLREFISVQH